MTTNSNQSTAIRKIASWTLTALGIFGTLFGVWAYFQTREVRSVTYLSRFPSKVFDSNSASKIRVTNLKGEPIKDDIYLQEIVLWNSGNQPLNPEDVRRPLEISLVGDPFIEILEFRVASQTQGGLPKFRLKRVGCCANKLLVSWKYFDPGQGARLHVIYRTINEEPLDVVLSGNILGVRGFVDGAQDITKRLVPWVPTWFTVTLIFSILFVAVVIIGAIIANFLDARKAPAFLGGLFMLLYMGIVLFTTNRLFNFLLENSSPPF